MRYKLHWLGGDTEMIEGDSISQAFTKAGYGADALRALDHYEVDKTRYQLQVEEFDYRSQPELLDWYESLDDVGAAVAYMKNHNEFPIGSIYKAWDSVEECLIFIA